jgi:hypothetical protein
MNVGFFEIGSHYVPQAHYVVQAGLELMIFLP